MMQPSMELRWFLRGALPQQTRDWFLQANKQTKVEEQRDDWYLCLPHAADVGIKMRQGKFEVKRLLHDGGLQLLRDSSVGRIEQWVKWSFEAQDGKAAIAEIATPPGQWICVTKKRALQRYQRHEDNQIENIPADTDPQTVPQGCNLELTEITVGTGQWYSLGFESFGPLETVEQTLWLTLEIVLQPSDFPLLQAEHSFSYPMWLQMICK